MGELDNSAAVAVTGKIMVIAIIFLFMVVVFVLFLHLYAKWFWWRMEQPPPPRRRRRFVFTPGQDPVRRGLDLSVLRHLPLVIFQSEDFKDGLECAVCLSEVEQEEKIRLLPKCNHGFHVDCIDMWFQSHSTCPLCRSSVTAITQPCNSTGNHELEMSIQSQDERLASGHPTECPNFPTNVLFWGDQTQMSTGVGSLEEGSSSSSPALPTSYSAGIKHQTLVIDIPEQMSENFGEGQDSKTPTPTPTSTRLRSLKRLLSREKRVSPTCSSGSAEV